MHILVVYFSQTGQLRQIIDSVLSPIKDKLTIEYQEIKPINDFPFPWTSNEFFDCMPESVKMIPEPIHPIQFLRKEYDLIILGYQPWFLSPSIPCTSFLKSEYASLLKGAKVLTIIGSRNMWLNAQEKVKAELFRLNATLVGNIVLFDRNPNLISLLTIIRWTFKGLKEASGRMPEAGVSKQDIQLATRFGSIIYGAMLLNKYDELQKRLLEQNAVELQSGLILLERRGVKGFRKFANYIYEKGKRGDQARMPRVKVYQRLLFVAVFILSPITNLLAKLKVLLMAKSLKKEHDYFISIAYKENAL